MRIEQLEYIFHPHIVIMHFIISGPIYILNGSMVVGKRIFNYPIVKTLIFPLLDLQVH